MRAKRTVRVPTAAQLLVGASVLAFPATALAVGGESSTTAKATPSASLRSTRPLAVGYDHETIVSGSAPRSDSGARIELAFRSATAQHWHSVDIGRVRPNGHFSLTARLARSGHLQVVPDPSTGTAVWSGDSQGANPVNPGTGTTTAATTTAVTTTAVTTTATAPSDAQTSGLGASAIRPVIVRPEMKLSRHAGSAVVGHPAHVTGHLLPGVANRTIVLDVRRGGRWTAVARGRTHRGGSFDLHYTPKTVGSQAVRVTFRGDRLNAHADSPTESISGLHYAEVSWYYDAGNTACGFHATYGVASRTLPCGSKVTFSYAGRSVVATVDDRGPFVYSRLYDLNQNTAGALGMHGVATVLASV